MPATWDPNCTWLITGHTTGPYGYCAASIRVQAPDPDSAMTIAKRNHGMVDFVQIVHVAGTPGRVVTD
jgi:hypothetical protein